MAGAGTRRLEFGPVTRTDIVKYAGAGGDFNPLHHDDDYARVLGYPAAFAMGLLTVGYLATAVEQWFGRDRIASFTTRFLAPVWVGELVICSAEPGEDGEVRLDVRNEAGEAKVSGRVTLKGVER
jgi:acyl dehydratase